MRTQRLRTGRAADGSCLELVFLWSGDRYRQALDRIDRQGLPTRLLESVEGSPREPWPPSPPLQQLSLQPTQDGFMVALAVGMAGDSHWSVSIEADPSQPRLSWDIACRLRVAAGQLSSQFEESIAMPTDATGRLLPNGLDRDRSTASRVSKDAGNWTFEPASLSIASERPVTVRWQFAWCWELAERPP